ncbi:hypothetical protein LTR95_006550 [Oleoguttula sp. CCFEE 5521]
MTTVQLALIDIGIQRPYFEGRTAGNRGIGVFATRDFPPATQLVTDHPLLTFFGSNAGQEDALIAQYQRLSARDKRKFDSLRTAFDHPNRTNPPRRPFILDADKRWRFEFNARVNVNLHLIIPKGERSVFKILSMFDHSCNANVGTCPRVHGMSRMLISLQVHFVWDKSGTCRGYNVGKILQDQELTFTYHGEAPYLVKAQRQPLVANRFICTCPTCSLPTWERLASDYRRSLISMMLIMLSKGEAPIRLSDAAEIALNDKQEATAREYLRHMNTQLTGAFFWLTLACLCEAEGLQSFEMCKWAAHGYISAADCALKHIDATGSLRAKDTMLAEQWSVRSRVLLERVRPGLAPGWLRVLGRQRTVPDSVIVDPAMD